jgi:hypothetical protein
VQRCSREWAFDLDSIAMIRLGRFVVATRVVQQPKQHVLQVVPRLVLVAAKKAHAFDLFHDLTLQVFVAFSRSVVFKLELSEMCQRKRTSKFSCSYETFTFSFVYYVLQLWLWFNLITLMCINMPFYIVRFLCHIARLN